jgi:hypothetical protein
MPRLARLAVLAAAPLLILTGCLDPKVDDSDVQRIRTAIERDVPAATVLEIKVRNALENCCGADVAVATQAADPAQARSLTRAVTRAAALGAPADTVTHVTNYVGGQGCAPPSDACWVDGISVSAAEAAWLWASPKGPAPTQAQRAGTACTGTGPDLTLPAEVFLRAPLGFDANPRFQLDAQVELPDQQYREAVDEVAEYVWGCYPAAIDMLTISRFGTAAGADPDLVSFTAQQLRQRFGSRPQDLPQ